MEGPTITVQMSQSLFENEHPDTVRALFRLEFARQLDNIMRRREEND